MKTAAFILASMVLFLSTQCMIMENTIEVEKTAVKKGCCSKKSSCSKPKKETPKKENSKNDCNSVCNPFLFCSGCTFENCVKPELVVPSSLYKSVQNGHKKDLFISAYISSMWNPPERI